MEVISQEPVNVNHSYSTRNKNSFLRPLKHHTSIYEKSVSYSGLKLFNMLPIEIKCLDILTFKYRIKKFLLNNPMYSINEFDILDKSVIYNRIVLIVYRIFLYRTFDESKHELYVVQL